MAQGGNATATATGIGTGTTAGHSSVLVVADGYGQNGGGVINGLVGNGGIGGTGTATAVGSNAGPDNLTIQANAIGGNGGQGEGSSFVDRELAAPLPSAPA